MQKIIESIARSEPAGRHTMDIANDIKLHRDTVFRLCKRLEEDDYIFRKNKQSEYHVTKKIYGYPELTAFSFGIKAMRTVGEDVQRRRERGQVRVITNCGTNEHEARIDKQTLREFAIRLGAVIEYIIIEALRPKKAFPNREKDGLVDLDFDATIIKGKDKDDIAKRWVENAIKAVSILNEFCRLWVVKRGLPVFADKDKAKAKAEHHHYYRSGERSLKPEVRRWLIEERTKVREMDVDDPYWSSYEMDEYNFNNLTAAHTAAFPDVREKLDSLMKDLPAEIESGLEMAREEKARIARLEKEDPHHVKCGGKLVPDVSRHKGGNNRYNKCTKCGRRFTLP